MYRVRKRDGKIVKFEIERIKARSPPYQACMMALQRSVSGAMAIAPPEQFTKMIFLPASCNVLSRDRCTAGSSMLVRSPPLNPGSATFISSPSNWGEMPPTKMMVSASPISVSSCSLLGVVRLNRSNCMAAKSSI